MRTHAESSMVSMARSTALFSGIPTEKSAPAACTARTTVERQYAESARTRIGPHAPARRAVAMVSRSIRTAPVAECAARGVTGSRRSPGRLARC